MTRWAINSFLTQEFSSDPSNIWTQRYTGRTTDYDEIMKLAEDGWELVSVTPLSKSGRTHKLLYTFKRPIEEGS
jgi:hypothetical protein